MADFERFIFVDWSASAKPRKNKNSIWIGCCQFDGEEHSFNADLTGYAGGKKIVDNWISTLSNFEKKEKFLKNSFVANPPTRGAALDFIKQILEQDKKKTLIGFDFGFGYPHKSYGSKDWKSLWEYLYNDIYDKDYEKKSPYPHYELASDWNKNHKLCFWGRGDAHKEVACHVSPKKDEAKLRMYGKNGEEGLGEFRITDERVSWSGVKSQWQMYGAGSVGSQSLLGIPYVEELRRCFGEKVKVWPFETNFGEYLKGFNILICEVHFAAICRVQERIARKTDALECQSENHQIPKGYPKDRIQVEEMCRFFAEEDKDGSLLQKFLKVDCSCISKDDRIKAQTKEGWILGAPLCLQPCDRPHTKKN